MSNWEHKAAHELAVALENHFKSATLNLDCCEQLRSVYRAAKNAATNDSGPEVLIHIRCVLCHACRGNSLYICDIDLGWSSNCTLIQKNSLSLRGAKGNPVSLQEQRSKPFMKRLAKYLVSRQAI
jgi:hypothetical protein